MILSYPFFSPIKYSLSCSWVVFSACFLPIEVWGLKGSISFCTVSDPFSPSWYCFHQNNFIKKNFVGFLWILLRFVLLKKSQNSKCLQDKPFSILDSHWGYCRTMPLKFLDSLLYSGRHLWGMACRSLEGLLSTISTIRYCLISFWCLSKGTYSPTWIRYLIWSLLSLSFPSSSLPLFLPKEGHVLRFQWTWIFEKHYSIQ